jgi:hypothetical protein
MHAVDHAIERFPASAAIVRRLYLSNEHFRSICQDLALSISELRRFEARNDAHLRPEVEDYRKLLGELELELREYLEAAEAELRTADNPTRLSDPSS